MDWTVGHGEQVIQGQPSVGCRFWTCSDMAEPVFPPFGRASYGPLGRYGEVRYDPRAQCKFAGEVPCSIRVLQEDTGTSGPSSNDSVRIPRQLLSSRFLTALMHRPGHHESLLSIYFC